MKLMGKFISIFSLLLLITSCNYSLSGYEILAKTAKVDYFENQAPIQSADVTQIFTNKLESAILRDTPLKLVQSNPEVEFSGAIVGYSLSPAAVTGTEQTAQTQLRVTVRVDYVDNTADGEEKSFSQSFSASETYDANLDLSAVESQLLESITDQLVQSIFNRAFIDW